MSGHEILACLSGGATFTAVVLAVAEVWRMTLQRPDSSADVLLAALAAGFWLLSVLGWGSLVWGAVT